MNRKRIIQAFANYVHNYDMADEAIRLKIKHTANVAQIADQITSAQNLDPLQQDLAFLIGYLHDIGRFEQLRRYHTFVDANSMNHALFGVSLLRENNKQLLRTFLDETIYDEIILTSIEQHNRFQIDENLTNETRLHTCILRDADKIDIFRINKTASEELLFQCTKDVLENDVISDVVWDGVLHHKSVLASKRCTHLDIFVSQLAMIFDLYFPCSFAMVKEDQIIEDVLNRYSFQHEETKYKMEELRKILCAYIHEMR